MSIPIFDDKLYIGKFVFASKPEDSIELIEGCAKKNCILISRPELQFQYQREDLNFLPGLENLDC
jgi:hypothetical protein